MIESSNEPVANGVDMKLHSRRFPEEPFLIDLFAEWQRLNYRYAVLRDYQTLPETTDGHDLDLLVVPEDLEPMFQTTRRVAARHRGQLLACYRQSGIIARFAGKEGAWWGVAIDFFSDLSYRGLPFFDAAKVLAHAISWRTIPVATQGDAMIVGFIKELLHNGCDRKNYRVLASREFCQDIPGYSVILEKCFGPKGALVLTRLFQQEPDRGEPLESVARHVRRLHKQQHRRISPGQYFKRRIHHALHRGRRLFFPPGYCLAMLGTDGSGKSAMIESIEQALGSALHGAIKTRHWRPGLLPSIVVLLGGKGPDGPVTNPHQAPGSGKIGSLLRLGYYALDFLLGYWLIVFPQLVRQPCLCIFDRYFYDFYMDPLRSRVNLPPWIVRLFDGFIPKPDLVICLGAEPEVIFARKPELSLKEITLQMDRLRRWQQTFSRSFWVDSGQSMEQTRDEVTTLLFRAMARKMERHYGIFPE